MKYLLFVGVILLICFLISLFLIYQAVQIDVQEFPEKYRKD